MSKLILRSLTLLAGQRIPVYEVASFFMLVSNSGSLRIKISIENDPLSEFPIGYEYREKGDGFFNRIDFQNPNAGTVVVEYIMSTGLVRSSPAVTALDEILAELRGDTTPEDYGEATIGVAQSQVLAANADRKSFTIQSKLANTEIVYVGFDNLVTSANWWAELQPGQSCGGDDYRGPLHAIATAADHLIGYAEV